MASPMDLSMGLFLIGVFLSVWLYGFSCIQAFMYFTMFKSDKAALKAFVAVLFATDTVHAVVMVISIYQYLVTNFGNMHYIQFANPAFFADPVLTSGISLMVQCFFAWRVHRLSGHMYLAIAILFFSIISFFAAIGTTVGVIIVRELARFQTFQVAVIVWLVGAAIADTIITASLFVTLNKARTGFAQTDDIITRLMRQTVQTGLLTSIFAIADIITFLASTSTLHLVFNLPLSKLYVNTMLATLNARALVPARGGHSIDGATAPGNGTKNHHVFRPNQPGNVQGVGRVHASHGDETAVHFNAVKSTGGGAAEAPRAVTRASHSFFGRRHEKVTALNPRVGDAETGVQITTVEERFEDTTLEGAAIEMVPSLGRTPPHGSQDDEVDEARARDLHDMPPVTATTTGTTTATTEVGRCGPDGRKQEHNEDYGDDSLDDHDSTSSAKSDLANQAGTAGREGLSSHPYAVGGGFLPGAAQRTNSTGGASFGHAEADEKAW